MKKIAINGFGRIGRLTLRALLAKSSKEIEVVAINDLTDAKTLANLFKYDSAHGKFAGEVKHEGTNLVIDGKTIPVYAEKDPANLPWKKLGVELVLECTGVFTTKEKCQKHIDAGAQRVLISAPAKGGDVPTIVYNVNHTTYDSKKDTVISAASCTTNGLAPTLDALNKAFGIKSGFMTTIHAYTADQRLQDAPHSDLRRARAAAVSMVPTSTGAAAAIGKVIPELSGLMDGLAIRVPTITGSIIDLVLSFKKDTDVKKINETVKKAANESLGYSEEPLVSVDIIGETHGGVFDAGLTKELTDCDGNKTYKMFIWYDNEFSYVWQMVRTINFVLGNKVNF